MVSGDKRNETSPASKTVTAVKEVAERKKDEPKNKSASDPHPAKAESGEKGAESPAGYSRGEKTYKDNWNAIYARKKRKKR